MPLLRLDRMLSGQGFGTRRDIKELLHKGLITVDGQTAKDADMKIDPKKSRIVIGDNAVTYKEHVYIMMNKPQGVVSASSDPKQQTVVDLLPPQWKRPGLFPAGRLDKDTEGMLILTDDGAFAHRILSPKKHVHKRYYAVLEKPVGEGDIAAFSGGITLDDGYVCLPAGLEADGTKVFITISEGKFHQIKRMFEARDNMVLYLKRVSMGGLQLDERLAPGESRELLPEEVALIGSAAGE